MRYYLYKLAIDESPGAGVFSDLRRIFESIREIDPDYKGPQHYWSFIRLGEPGDPDLTLVKMEIWTGFKEDGSGETNYQAYVGAACGLFFYDTGDPGARDYINRSIKEFLNRRHREAPPFMVVALYNGVTTDREKIEADPEYISERAEVEKERGAILPIDMNIIRMSTGKLLKGFFKYFLFALNPDLKKMLGRGAGLSLLNSDGVRALILTEFAGEETAGVRISETEAGVKAAETSSAPVEESIPEEILEKLETEENLAVSPDGRTVKIENPTHEILVELSRKGYRFSRNLRAIIPRFCPTCGNWNQKMIFERIDKNRLLMDYPRIYAIKCVCGVCGTEWDQNSRRILKRP